MVNENSNGTKNESNDVKKYTRSQLILDLSLIKDDEEVIKFLESKSQIIDIGKLSHSIHDCLLSKFGDRYDELYSETVRKIELYKKYVRDKRSAERKADKRKAFESLYTFAYDRVTRFVASSHTTIKSFCKNEGLDEEMFKNYVEVIKELNPELYDKYSEKTRDISRQYYAVIASHVRRIVDYIKNGIEDENGDIRQFDVIDFYKLQKYDLSRFNEFCTKVLDKNDNLIIKQFMGKNNITAKPKRLDVKAVLSNETEVNCRKDENGFPIKGTGRVVTEEEKLLVMEYLKNNKIPLTLKTYNLALKKYLDNELFNEAEKVSGNINK